MAVREPAGKDRQGVESGAGTAAAWMSKIGTTFVALPVSILVTVVMSLVFSGKSDLSKEHLDKCFEGI